MKLNLRNFIGPLLAMIAGYLIMQHLIKPTVPAATPPSIVSTGASSSATSIKEPVLSLPEFSLKNRDDQLQSIHSWPGKSLIINFWATWCEPCRREIPLLIKLQQEHANEGFQVVGIAIDFRDAVLKYATTTHFNYPLLIGEQDGLNAVDAFGIEQTGFPFTVFTDKNGNIIITHLGELHATQAGIIMNAVQRVNRGELAVEAARTQVNAALMHGQI